MIEIVDIVFRILNFIVVLFLGRYAMMHYIIPFVNEEIKRYKKHLDQLQENHKSFQADCRQIEENLNDQETFFNTMNDRLKIWTRSCQDHKAFVLENQKKIRQKIEERFEVRSSNVKNNMILQKNIPTILEKSKKILQKKYMTSTDQKKYMKNLLHNMEKNS